MKTNETNTPEPLAAILAEMREWSTDENDALARYADRIEAAYKREHADWHAETEAAKDARNRVACRMRSEFAEKCRNCTARAPGNAAAVRDALERSTRRLHGVVRELPLEMQKFVNADIRDNDAALAAPARNCDVGTAEEQAERFKAFCDNYHTCSCCPLNFTDDITACPIEWSQMPFAQKKGDAK